MFHVKHRAEALVLNIESAIPLHTTTPVSYTHLTLPTKA